MNSQEEKKLVLSEMSIIEPKIIHQGDDRVMLNGEPPKADVRIISEGQYQAMLEIWYAHGGKVNGIGQEDAANLVSALEQWHAAQHAREHGRHPLMHCQTCGELVLHDHECKPNSPAEAAENVTMSDAGTLANGLAGDAPRPEEYARRQRQSGM
jgi:hypothetical protein